MNPGSAEWSCACDFSNKIFFWQTLGFLMLILWECEDDWDPTWWFQESWVRMPQPPPPGRASIHDLISLWYCKVDCNSKWYAVQMLLILCPLGAINLSLVSQFRRGFPRNFYGSDQNNILPTLHNNTKPFVGNMINKAKTISDHPWRHFKWQLWFIG